MPNTKSAIKALRQSVKRRSHNLSRKNAYKLSMKELKKMVADGKRSEALQLLATAYKKLDKAAKSGVIAKNKASRLKAKAARLVAAK